MTIFNSINVKFELANLNLKKDNPRNKNVHIKFYHKNMHAYFA